MEAEKMQHKWKYEFNASIYKIDSNAEKEIEKQ